ncbi:hypothetical protein NIES2100_53910 [Calothrix sp. NIES-2100]|nr:hypothetical protein NIES2100_53910 [Calothrix sp. NIES-2100]
MTNNASQLSLHILLAAINNQDLDPLGWIYFYRQTMTTAQGDSKFEAMPQAEIKAPPILLKSCLCNLRD